MNLRNISGFMGRTVLRGANRRTTCPPGELVPNGNRGIIVATPPRSGTHVAINLLLNNLPAYRREPLYVELDALQRRKRLEGLLPQLEAGPGHVMKTHFPITFDRRSALMEQMRRIASANLVVVVKRDADAIEKSMKAWAAEEPLSKNLAFFLENIRSEIDFFWQYWKDFETVEIAFEDLMQPATAQRFLCRIADTAGVRLQGEPDRIKVATSSQATVLLNKGLTRLIGARAPMIDTSIRALRRG
jgi:hypothetical protein